MADNRVPGQPGQAGHKRSFRLCRNHPEHRQYPDKASHETLRRPQCRQATPALQPARRAATHVHAGSVASAMTML